MQQKNSSQNKYNLVNIQVSSFNLNSLLNFINESVTSGVKTIITHHNAHSIYLQHKDELMKTLLTTAVNFIDGMPIVYMGKLLGYPLKRDNRITWVDLIRPLIKEAEKHNWKVFYLGADEVTVSKGISVLRNDYPGLNIVYANGFFNASINSAENKSTIQKINAFAPDLLIVGMGMPRQEKWILENKEALHATVIMTSGAAIEYVAGKVSTPPRWMGRTGLEWLYRLTENPKRFWFRYMIEPWFVFWLFVKDLGKKYVLRKEL